MPRQNGKNTAYERDLETFFYKRVRLMGGRVIKLAPMQAGIPDRLVFFDKGRMYLVELKRDDTDLSEIQKVWHARLRAMGHTVVVLHGKAEIVEWIRQVVDSVGPRNRKPGRKPTK